MAAPDFPASPTVGQTYTAPSGLIYTWDGKVWSTTGAPQSAYWTDTATALTPTTATKSVLVTEPSTTSDAYQCAVSGTIAKAYLDHGGTGVSLRYNANGAGTLLDDSSKASWVFALGFPDQMNIFRAAATAGAPTFSPLLGLDNAGNLTTTGTEIILSRGTAKTHVGADPAGGNSYLFCNRGVSTVDDATKPVWALLVSQASDNFLLHRCPAGAGLSGSVLLSLDNAGNLTINGATAQKASGTTWSNPSDIRLKENVKDYARGLADILRLHPISYTLKATGTETCGFDADRVREVFPECVGTTRMKLNPDDEEETDVLTFDMHAILVALVNAVQELASK